MTDAPNTPTTCNRTQGAPRTVVCGWCGINTPVTTRDRKMFCTPKCKRHWHNLQTVRGHVTNPLLQAWRLGRNVTVPKGASASAAKVAKAQRAKAAASWAWTQLCAAADRHNAEDVEAGRMTALDYAAAKMASGWGVADL